ncbi:folate-binding protein [Burkholderiaceae bacterium DAT-1]|nr:folate-binding protein [Burkholderiaceae bacterium DAT-1]
MSLTDLLPTLQPTPSNAYPDGGTTLSALASVAWLRFTGEDTLTFLQGQLSSDVRAIGADQVQYSSYSTPKGRMLATFLIIRSGDDYLLGLPNTIAPAIQKRLSMYIMRSKTRVSDESGAIGAVGLAGTQAHALLNHLNDIPTEDMHSKSHDDIRVVRLNEDRFLVLAPNALLPELWTDLAARGANPATEAAWELAAIRAGIVTVLAETQEAFVPQMANLELIGAVNFKKGCYPGQEIVARTQYLGKLKRRTIRVLSEVELKPGEEVFSPEMNGQPSGTVAMAAQNEHGRWEALVVVQTASIEHGLHVQNPEGPVLTQLPLPYAIPA